MAGTTAALPHLILHLGTSYCTYMWHALALLPLPNLLALVHPPPTRSHYQLLSVAVYRYKLITLHISIMTVIVQDRGSHRHAAGSMFPEPTRTPVPVHSPVGVVHMHPP